jgi:hypothetical protein
MRNVIVLLLLVTLCSNECNAPYRANIVCRDSEGHCKVQVHDSLELSMTGANVGWWKGTLDIGIYYTRKNTSIKSVDPLDYSCFSVVSSNGIKFHQTHSKDKIYGAATIPPGETIDSIFVFYTAEKYSKKEALKILRNERFFFLYSHGSTDTLFTVVAADNKIK